MNQSLSSAQYDLFGDVLAEPVKPKRPPLQRTEEQRSMLSVNRFRSEFCMSSLFAEIEMQPVTDDDDDCNEGKANPELDAQLRVSNAVLLPYSDACLTRFVLNLHRACLDNHLAFLESEDEKPRVLLEKGYILQWIFCVDVVRGTHQKKIPFSFHNCCMAAACDPDTLRGHLLQKEVVRALLVRLSLVEECKLPPLRKKVFYGDFVGYDHPMIGNQSVAISGV